MKGDSRERRVRLNGYLGAFTGLVINNDLGGIRWQDNYAKNGYRG
jgi:hypothetical protein